MLIVNENGDFFFFDWLLGQLLLFPFTLKFLSLYAGAVHLCRAVR
jgi:hypothetical protein